MKKENIQDSIKVLLFPYLKKSLRADTIIPKQLYMFLEEGNGGLPGYVFNSMLQTARLNGFKVGAIAAHESFHSIVGPIFNKKLTAYHDLSDFQQSLLYFMEMIAEEGVADLIDKPVLGQKGSPLYGDVARLAENEEVFARQNLRKIDSLLKQCLIKTPASFNFRQYSKNGGHIPGRYMAACIKKAGLLPDIIEGEGDPLIFFESFAAAAKKLHIESSLSVAALGYLEKTYRRD